MTSEHFVVVGLVLNMVGAFFLSVEAIKVDNLKKLQRRLLVPLHRATIPPKVKVVQGPLPPRSFKERLGTASSLSVFVTLHQAAGAAVLLLCNSLLDGRLASAASLSVSWVIQQHTLLRIPIVLGIGALVIPILFFLGEIVHIGLVRGSRLLIDFVDFIERHTATGVVGIIGLIFMMIGYAAQLYAIHISP